MVTGFPVRCFGEARDEITWMREGAFRRFAYWATQ